MTPDIHVPPQAAALMARLEQAGYPAYVVGGCVRDSLLGRAPGDWDICTGAKPDALRRIFAGEQLILAGEKHGTVAVVQGGKAYEITTFRVDGAYSDHRHPEKVAFVPELGQDLARRDLTVNAMAWRPGTGLVDLFGGQKDLAAGVIRCVGAPEKRFAEDALRILRALRFAAQLGFAVEPATAAAAEALRDTVQSVSAERVFHELDLLLAGAAAGRVLAAHGAALAGAVPELLPCMGCGQPGRWHCYDVWQHTAAAVAALPAGAGREVRWAVFLHDLAKPQCKTVETDGTAHFYGHNQRGAKLAREILRRLRAPKGLESTVVELVAVHDSPLPRTDAVVLRLLNQRGPDFLRALCQVKYADLAAHRPQPDVDARAADVRAFETRMADLAKAGCWKVSHLAVTGGDVMDAGTPAGPLVGVQLDRLLEAVMAGTLPNEREALLKALQKGL